VQWFAVPTCFENVAFTLQQQVCRPLPANASSRQSHRSLPESTSAADEYGLWCRELACQGNYKRRNLAHQNGAPTLDVSAVCQSPIQGEPVKYQEIIARVAERTGLFEGEAVELTHATLATLAERISGDEARALATRLPGPMQDDLLPTNEQPEAFSFDEFVNRVAERSRRGPTASKSAVDAVLATLREAVPPGEFDCVLSHLPRDFHRLDAR
jgi:uncharacterized protein (DUF2267 family)